MDVALLVFGSVMICVAFAVIGSWVCPQVRPQRISGYDDSFV